MRTLMLVLILLATACTPLEGISGFAGAEAASVVVFGRGVVDIGVSAVTGRDCSIVRLDRRQTYCAPRDTPFDPGPICTRSLGVVDCWSDPADLPPMSHTVGDTPVPNVAQERYRRARWPKSLFAG